MFMAGAKALSEHSPAIKDSSAPLLPDIRDILSVSKKIALAVGQQAQREYLAPQCPVDELKDKIAAKMWTPAYAVIRPETGQPE
jgi:malate dehydrogenase (oxaloacetate-decarboxylating)